MNSLSQRIRAWAHENKLLSAFIVGGGLGVLFLTGTPFWWEPARQSFWVAWQWGLSSHGVAGWVLGLTAPVVFWSYGKAALWLWRGWRPLPVPPPHSPRIAKLVHAEPVVDTIEGVQWRGTLCGGKLHELTAHCPKCLFKIEPKRHEGYRSQETAYICDGCRDFKVQITGNSFSVETRVTWLIEASWLRRQEASKVLHG